MKKIVYAAVIIVCAAASIFIGYQKLKKPMVSVVMLTYKRADIVSNAVDSILKQTYPDFEFIILNDGSPDNTDEVIKKYNDSRIRYYKNKQNKGIAYSRNRAAGLARGKYIMVMDDDDISLPERMEKEVRYLETHPKTDVIVGQIESLPRVPQEHDLIASNLILYNNVGNANMMYRRAFANEHLIKYDEQIDFGEDWDFWLSMLFAGAKFAALKDDVLIRNAASKKHYIASNEADRQLRDKIGRFFAPNDPQTFYHADSCQKITLIAAKNILSPAFILRLKELNCP